MEASPWDRRLARIQRLARDGGDAEAIPMVFRILEQAPDYEPAWVFLAAASCRQGCHAEVPAMIDRYQTLTGRGPRWSRRS